LRRQAEINEKSAQREALKNQQVASFLKNLLGEVKASVELGKDTSVIRDILDRTAPSLKDNFGDQPEVEAEIREVMGDTYSALYLLPQAQEMLRAALRLQESLSATNDLKRAMLLAKLSAAVGGILAPGDTSDPVEAERLIRQAMAIQDSVSDRDPRQRIYCLNRLGQYRYMQADFSGAESLYSKALELQQQNKILEGIEVEMTLFGLGAVRRLREDLDGAELALREVIKLARKRIGETANVSGDLEFLGDVLQRKGEMPESEKLYLESLEIRKRVNGDKSPLTALNKFLLATFYSCWKREPEAKAFWRQLLGTRTYGDLARKSLEAISLRSSLIPILAD